MYLTVRYLLLLTALASTVNGYVCPPGWLSWKDNCYYISARTNPTKSWHHASTFCNQMQADLLYIESQEEFNWLANEMNERTTQQVVQQEWWTGLTDADKANSWVWSANNLPMDEKTTLKWVDGYPKDHNKKDCEHKTCNRCSVISTTLDFIPLVRKESSVNGLSEQGCQVKKPYICKRTNISDSPSHCDYGDGWHEVGKTCWKSFSNRKMSWYEAKEYCEHTEHSQLAVVHSSDDQFSLLTVSAAEFDTFWIGLQINKTGSHPSSMWVDGTTLDHDNQPTYWAPQQPDFAVFGRGCVYMDNSKVDEEGWHIDGCYESKSFICQKAQGVCKPGLSSFNGRCYEFNVQNRRSWDGAKKYCEAQNMTLFEINNKMEEAMLKGSRYLYRRDVDAMWMGFNGYLGSYTWISGGHVNPSIFVIPEKLSTSNELCGIIYTDGGGKMTVSDNCGHRYPFICEAGVGDSVIDYKHPPVNSFCEYDHFQYKGHCYKMYSDVEKSWGDARAACQQDGAKLLSISDSQEQAFINAHTSIIYWIGLRKYPTSHRWRWDDYQESVDFRNFMPGSENLQKRDRDCVFMMATPGQHKGQWRQGVCDAEFSYICEKLATVKKTTPPSRPRVPECVDGFCYELNEEHRVWAEAQDDCKSKGGNLVSISSPYEQTTVQQYIPHHLSGLSLWIGGSDKTSSSAWAWVDGTPFSYMNWHQLTRQSDKLDRCLAMRLEGKTWVSDECNRKKPYICEKRDVDTPVTTAPTTDLPTTTLPPGMKKTCPDSYDLIGSNCYKFYNETVTQKSASEQCRKDNAFLASVQSKLEDRNEMQRGWVMRGHSMTPKWWIGLEDRDNDGEFRWQDGTEVKFLDWAEHQPADVYGTSNCVVMTSKKGQWEVRSCSDLADGFICKSPPTIAKASKDADMSTVCPPMANRMTDTSCYLTAFSHFDWDTAKESCETNNMQLAWIDTTEEAAFVLDIYRGAGYSLTFWLNYKNHNGTTLIEGLPVGTHQYLPPWNKEHTGNDFDSCTYFKARTGQLHDGECDTLRPFLCKAYRIDYVPVPPVRPTECPHKWNLAGDKCYKTFQSWRRPEKKSWYEARDHCRALGGDLASIHSEYATDEHLTNIFKNQFGQVTESEYWIGLNILDRSKGYQWSDSSNLDMVAWNEEEPNDHRRLENCVVATIETSYNKPITMKWNDKYCPTSHDYVCQVPAGTRTATLMPTTTLPAPSRIPGVQGKCDPGWLQFTVNCYKFKQEYLSWHEAKKDCEEEDSHLVVIHTKEENAFITSQITRTSQRHWTIGLTQYGGTDWGWVDGSPLDFAPWHEGEPSDHGGSENCGQMYYDSGFWNDFNCAMQSRGHICQRPLNGVTYPPTTTIEPGLGYCPNGFTSFDDKCFGIFGSSAPLNWTDAQAQCRAKGKGYDLASVLNSKQQAFIEVEVYNLKRSVWIGFSDMSGFRRFVWSNNDPVSKTYWAAFEPHYSHTTRCVRLETENPHQIGKWKGVDCSTELMYMCSGPTDTSISTPPTTVRSKVCPAGYEEYNGECYKLYDSPSNFEDAADICARNADNSYLVSISSAAEDSFLRLMLARSEATLGADIWIGMRRQEYVVNKLTVGQYMWEDGQDVRYTRWSENQPRHVDSVPNCVSMNTSTGRWSSVDCNPTVIKPYICKISNKPLPTRSPHQYLCDNPLAIQYRDQCYTVNTPRSGKTWSDASSECTRDGMRLASIHDGDTQDFLTAILGFAERPSSVWIGLLKSKTGAYVWSDSSEVEYEQWAAGQPSPDHQDQTDICVFMSYQVSTQFGYGANWTSDRCYARKGWICQEPAHVLTEPTTTGVTTTPTTTVKQFCDGDRDWKYYNGDCYYLGNERISWHDSQAKCKSMGADLASFHGRDEINAVFSGNVYMTSYIAAIGLTKLGLSNWQWTDKSYVDFVNWWTGEPNNHDKSERCAFMFTHTRRAQYEKGRWNDQHCGTLGGYVCKKPEHPRPITLSPAIMYQKPGHCPTNWVEYGGMCYGLFTDKPLNWTDARDTCRTKGLNADLLAVHNVKEQAFLSSQLYNLDENIWTGLSDRFWNNHFWWSNNDKVQYTNWVEGEPDLKNTHNCVEMMLHPVEPGKWRDVNCSLELNYICVMDKDVRISTPAPTPDDKLCQDKYVYYNGACYKYYNTKVSFDDAEDKCVADNAELVSVNSVYEQMFVESMLVFVNEPVWLGLAEFDFTITKNISFGSFFWEDGWPVTYTHWDEGRPVSADTSERKCVSINPLTGKWNDTYCYFTHSFVCKKTDRAPPSLPPAQYKCNNDEVLVEDKCLLFGAEGKKSWSNAYLACHQLGKELASIHNIDQAEGMLTFLGNNDVKANVWLGLVRHIKSGFYWLDKSPVDWTYWSRDEPNDKNDDEACVEMVWRDNGKWNDVNCNNWLNYVCMSDAVPISTTPTTPTTTITPTTRRLKTTKPTRSSTPSTKRSTRTTASLVTSTTTKSTRKPHTTRSSSARPRLTTGSGHGSDQSRLEATTKDENATDDHVIVISGLVAGGIIVLVIGTFLGFFIHYRVKQAKGYDVNSRVHYKSREGSGAESSLRFTNQLYDKDIGDNNIELHPPS